MAASAAIFGANAAGTWVLGPYNYTADTIYHATTGPGITTTAVRLSSANGANRTNIFYSTIDLTNPDLELRGVQALDKQGSKESVKAMGERKNGQYNGQYIVGVNGDFFNMSGTAKATGHAIIEGQVNNVCTDAFWNTWASYALVEGAKDIRLKQNISITETAAGKYTVKSDGKIIEPSHLIGGCSMIVMNGELAPAKYFSGSIVDHFATNQARTAIGYNKDRTQLILLVADKYSSCTSTDPEKQLYGNSTGMVLERMGHIMLQLGCYTAMNFDGGGSSQLYNKEFGIRNVPYGADYLRPVSNGFFAVSTTPEDNNVAALEVLQKNVSLEAGEKFTPVVYAYNKYGVLINKNVKGFTLSVAPSLGSVSGTTFTAGGAKGSTIAVVTLDGVKCGVSISTNGGGTFATSGDDNAPIMVAKAYKSDEPMGIDQLPVMLTERWHFVTPGINDGWDGTAPNWSNTEAIKSKSCPRFATARKNNFYTVDMKTMSIAEIDSAGNMTAKYKLPSLEGRTVNGVPDYYGAAISRDDAGNFLIGHLFTKTDTYRVWTVYNPRTGKAKHFEINLGGNPSNGRIDNIGRIVGDMLTDAYVYVAPRATGSLASQCTLIIHFEGDGTIESVEATPSFDKGLWLAGVSDPHGLNTFSICQPKYTSIDEMEGVDLINTFYWYSKTPKGTMGSGTVDLFTRENGIDSPNYATDWNNYSGLNGFDTFTLGGKRYFVVNYAAENEAKSGQHIIVMDEQSTKAAEWINPDFTSGAGYNTITAVPVNSDQVDIYVYNCTGDFSVDGNKVGAIAGARLTMSIGDPIYVPEEPDLVEKPDEPSTGIDDILTDDAPAVFYNLQGVEIKNPTPGIYIVRRGNRVTKELLR